MNKMMFRKPMFRRSMMRVTMLALCTTLLGTVPMVAQDNTAPPPPPPPSGQGTWQGGHGGGGEHQLEMMTKQLNLSPDQVTQIKAINQDTMKQAMAVRDDSSIAQADKRTKMMDIRKASQDKIRGVLNDDQKTKYDAMLAEMREHRGNHQGGDNAPPPPPPPQQ